MMMRLLVLLLVLVSTLALAPPHPDAEHEVHEIHRSLKHGSSYYNDAPRLVNAALCSGLTEAECFELNQEFEEQARKLRLIYQTTGYLKVLVLLMRFSNHEDRELPTPDQYHGVFNSPVSDPLYAEPGSVKNFLEVNSGDSLEIDFDIMPWKTTDNTEAFYSYNISGVTRDFGQSLHAVMDQLEADGVDFSDYDLDGDGKIDVIMLLHSGYQAEVGNIDCYTGALTPQRIWSHAIANPTKIWTSPSSGIQTDNYAVGGAMRGVCRTRLPAIGVITHELLHNFGLPDLNDNSGEYIGKGLGHYSIMSNPYGVNNLANSPCHLTPREKIFLGWLEPIEIETNGRYELRDSETTADVYIIKKHFQILGDEYFLIENRQPKLFDQYLWNGGILVWHIDDTQPWMRERGYPGQEGWPGNGRHYQIALLSPDGRYDIEVGRNSGDSTDFWSEGMEIGPGLVEEVATDAGTYPNTNSYQSGLIQQTGIRIYDMSSSGDVMSFSVEGLGGVPASLAPSVKPTNLPTLAPVATTTSSPTVTPTSPPTFPPTITPTLAPVAPIAVPTDPPTFAPIAVPTDPPTLAPVAPTLSPTGGAIFNPSSSPSKIHSDSPSSHPTTSKLFTIPSQSRSYQPSTPPLQTPSSSSSPTAAESVEITNVFDRPSGASVGSVLQTESPTSASFSIGRVTLPFVTSLLLMYVVLV